MINAQKFVLATFHKKMFMRATFFGQQNPSHTQKTVVSHSYGFYEHFYRFFTFFLPLSTDIDITAPVLLSQMLCDVNFIIVWNQKYFQCSFYVF